MSRLAQLTKRHTLVVGLIAVAIPLTIMLAMQYVWLSKLERTTAIAYEAALHNYLEAVGSEIQYHYRAAAERSLNLPSSVFTQDRLDDASFYWKKKEVPEAERLFLVNYTDDPFGNFLVFDRETGKLRTPPASDESLAIIVACTPWQMVAYADRDARGLFLTVDERNPEYRMILNPITDSQGSLAGVAGMILDEDHFREELLPAIVDKSLAAFFPSEAAYDLAVAVRNAKGGVVLGEPEEASDAVEVYSARFPFVFTDWTIGISGGDDHPEQYARASFVFNMGLSILLAGALIGGILLALRAADRAVKLSKMKTDFVSNVSHELRTPLSSIRVFAELLRLGRVQSPDKIREYGEYIETESRRLSRLISNILDFARIESGAKTYRFVPSDVNEVVEATLHTFEVRFKHSGFEVVFERPAPPLPKVALDADALGQAVHNLLDNAMKYSGDSKRITVSLSHDDGWVQISVRDEGIGIPSEQQKKIFERFHRAGTSLVHNVKGSGLGLSIVHHVVRAHGGQVGVTSEPLCGSTFTIRLPAAREPRLPETSGAEESCAES